MKSQLNPGVLLKGPGVLLKGSGVLLKGPGVLLKGPGILLKGPGVRGFVTVSVQPLPQAAHDGPQHRPF